MSTLNLRKVTHEELDIDVNPSSPKIYRGQSAEDRIGEHRKRLVEVGIALYGAHGFAEMDYNENDSAKMTGTPLERARGALPRRKASPVPSMVRESSATLVSGASRIPLRD